jgi:hypothetical protein
MTVIAYGTSCTSIKLQISVRSYQATDLNVEESASHERDSCTLHIRTIRACRQSLSRRIHFFLSMRDFIQANVETNVKQNEELTKRATKELSPA